MLNYGESTIRFRMRPSITLVAFFLLTGGKAVAQTQPPSGFGDVAFGGEDVTCAQCLVREMAGVEQVAVGNHSFEGFSWPLRRPLHDGLVLVNYVDDDPSNLVRDYMGEPHSYNGHRGTDFTLYTFREMDRGVSIVAAAPGMVLGTIYDHPDRNIGPPYPDSGNGIWIEHDDGVVSYYWHPRTNSIAVEPGEYVETGQFLAFAGSSGYSTDAHLHFEVQESQGNMAAVRDPWTGTNNPLPSMWRHQEDYVGYDSLRIYDIGFTTKEAVGGDFHVVTARAFKERLPQPLTLGLDEPQIGLWFLFQGPADGVYTVRLFKPDSSIYAEVTHSLDTKSQYAFHYWYWNLLGLSESDTGNWQATVSEGEKELARLVIPMATETVFPPRFWPIAGRSFRLSGEMIRDTLRVSALGRPVSFRLDNAPEFASLADSIVTISPPSSQEYRSFFFNAIAEDGGGHADTMRYHLVDPTRPLDPIPVAVASTRLPGHQLNGLRLYPNPARGETIAVLSVGETEMINVEVYDVAGRLVLRPARRIYTAGRHTVLISLRMLPAGAYVVRASGNRLTASATLVLTQ